MTERGVTLVETLTALAVASIVILGMSGAFLFGMRGLDAVRAHAALADTMGYVAYSLSHSTHRAVSVSVPSSDIAVFDTPSGAVSLVWDAGAESLTLGGAPLTPGSVRVQSLTFSPVGGSLHVTCTFVAGRYVQREVHLRMTFTPRG